MAAVSIPFKSFNNVFLIKIYFAFCKHHLPLNTKCNNMMYCEHSKTTDMAHIIIEKKFVLITELLVHDFLKNHVLLCLLIFALHS